jgi:C-terminal processing protease CtpA/Prc
VNSYLGIIKYAEFLYELSFPIIFRAGIYPGDIIMSINGNKVSNSQQVYDFVAKAELLTIEILRGPKRLRVVVQPEMVP